MARVSDNHRPVENVRRPSANQQTKTCKGQSCKTVNPQPIENFTSAPGCRDGKSPQCRNCKKAYDAARRKADPARSKSQSAQYYRSNIEKVQARHKVWRENNKEYTRSYLKAYCEKRPGFNAAKVMKYVAAKLKATPAWITKEQLRQIEEVYATCPEGFEVDHIIPLRGKTVSGLHVPWNLQHLSIGQNRSKGNKF